MADGDIEPVTLGEAVAVAVEVVDGVMVEELLKVDVTDTV